MTGKLTRKETGGNLLTQVKHVHEAVMSDPRRFAAGAEDMVRRARSAQNPEALALALRAQAWAQRAQWADVTAKRLLDEAARIARRHGLSETLAEVLLSRSAINQELGRLSGARRDLDSAATLLAPQGTAELSFRQAVLQQNIGQLADAAALYRSLLSSPSTPDRLRVVSANNLALIEAQYTRYVEATSLLDEQAHTAAELGPTLVALLLQSRAWVTVQSGRLTDGVRLFEQAGRAYRAAGLPLGEHYVEYADALMDLRLIPEAISAARAGVEDFRRGNVPLMGAEADLRVAQLQMLSGDAVAAEAGARAAAESFGRQGRGLWKARATLVAVEARLRAGTVTVADLRSARRVARSVESLGTGPAAVQAHLVAGRVAAAMNRTADAVEALRRGKELAEGAPALVRLRGRVAIALAERLLGNDGETLAHCRRGMRELARYRAALPSAELRALASGHGAELGQLGLDVVVRGGCATRVLDWMERTRATALLALQPPHTADIQEDLERLRGVYAELESLSQRGTSAPAIPRLLARQGAIESRIRRATWRGPAGVGTAGETATVARLRAALAGRVLVEYGVLDDRLVAVVLEPRRCRLLDLGTVGPIVEQNRALLFALRRLTQPRAEAALAAARLSADVRLASLAELLLRPLGLPSGAELVVVPVGFLHGIPWSALHDAPVSLAPSATFWARSAETTNETISETRSETASSEARDGHPTPGCRVTLIAGPNLPGAAAEVRALQSLYPRAAVSTPPASTAAAVAPLLRDADLAHLACHGRLRSDNPMFSALMLSDGPLTLQELQIRGVAPHRLVLASCESGAEVKYAGDEVLGFVSALLACGTGGVVASIVAIPDVAAADLMYALHQGLTRGLTLAHALYQARLSLLHDEPGAFVTWCTFGVHGAA